MEGEALLQACVAGNGLMTATVDKGSKFFLTLTATLPYTKDQFESKQDKYEAAVASAAGTVAANVEIVEITEARRRAGKVAVETKILAADQAGLDFMQFTLKQCIGQPEDETTKCKIDKALQREGLEKSTATAKPTMSTAEPTMSEGAKTMQTPLWAVLLLATAGAMVL